MHRGCAARDSEVDGLKLGTTAADADGMAVASQVQEVSVPRSQRHGLLAAAVLWAAVALGAVGRLTVFAGTPGQAGGGAHVWPTSSTLHRTADEPTLVVAVHPMCPCSRASVAELARIAARAPRRLRILVIFTDAATDSSAVRSSDLWQSVAMIPGATPVVDAGGAEAALFDAKTSGYAALYAADGKLVFHGGITVALGHQGDNAGSDAILELLSGASASRPSTPVFGCPLGELPPS